MGNRMIIRVECNGPNLSMPRANCLLAQWMKKAIPAL